MTFKFKSQAAQDLVMLQSHAQQLLQLIGKDAAASGILEPQDMTATLAVLKALPAPEAAPAQADKGEHDDAPSDQGSEGQQVSLRQRAWPLIQMIERAQAANKPIVWGV
jgi:hypothetical protein